MASIGDDLAVHEEPAKDNVGLLAELPPEFIDFLRDNGVPLEAYCQAAAHPLPRFVRVNPQGQLVLQSQPGHERAKVVAEALGLPEAEMDAVQPIRWLNCKPLPWADVYACPAKTSLSQCEAYRNGSLYGIDAASVFAVRCLDPQPGDHILDLCCAPGAKLCTLCDAVSPSGQVVGVDIAEQRLAACRTVLRKYKVSNARLSLGDGTCWDPQNATWLDLDPPRGRGQRGRKRRLEAAVAAKVASQKKEEAVGLVDSADGVESAEENEHMIGSVKAAASSGSAAEAPVAETAVKLFDRVLVDAECTHDGSLRHIEKYRSQWGWQTLADRVPWVKSDGLYDLQSGLLRNGFRLLREGGILVYSTCSLCRMQNENVVATFLKQEPSASFAPLPVQLLHSCDASTTSTTAENSAPARPSLLESDGAALGEGNHFCTARFDPATSGTSGLFIACFTRKPFVPPPE